MKRAPCPAGLGVGLSAWLLVVAGCAHAPASVADPTPVRLVFSNEAPVELDAPAEVERAVRRRIAARPELVVSSSPDAARLEVRIRDVRGERLAGSDPSLRAPRYRVRVELWGEVRQPGREPLTARAFGEELYVARPGGIGVLDGAARTFIARASEEAADRLVDLIAGQLARLPSVPP